MAAERVQRLRKLCALADQRPVDLLRLMESIQGRSIEEDEIAKKEFVRRLPAQTQLIVRFQADVFTVEQLAQMTDRLASVPVMHDMSPNFAITHAESSRENEVVSLSFLHQQLSKLTNSNDSIAAEVAELNRSVSYTGNRRLRGGPRRARMYRSLNVEGLCWYHLVWGSRATKCADGCRQAEKGRTGR